MADGRMTKADRRTVADVPCQAACARRAPERIRARLSSGPSNSIVSNRPGLTVRPVSETRTACMKGPALTPRVSAVPLTTCSIVTASNGATDSSCVGQRREVCAHLWGQVFGGGGRVEDDRRHQRPETIRDVTESLGTRPQERQGAYEPGSILAIEVPAPQSGLLQPGARVGNQHVIGQLHDVLVVHPLELHRC